MLPGFSTPVKNIRLLNQSNIDYNILHSIAQGRYKYVHDTQSYFIIQKETYVHKICRNERKVLWARENDTNNNFLPVNCRVVKKHITGQVSNGDAKYI